MLNIDWKLFQSSVIIYNSVKVDYSYLHVSSMSGPMQWWTLNQNKILGVYPEPSFLSNKAIVSPFIKTLANTKNTIHSVLLDVIHNYLTYN